MVCECLCVCVCVYVCVCVSVCVYEPTEVREVQKLKPHHEVMHQSKVKCIYG